MNLRFLTAGESHGPVLTAILEGIPAGLVLDEKIIDLDLERRQRGYGAGPRMKTEKDHAQILGGMMNGETTGAPIALQIANADHKNWKGKEVKPMTAPRPGHADLTGAIKYGYTDLRPALERASARETAARVAVGAICKHFLVQCGIVVGGYVHSIGEISADLDSISYEERFRLAETSDVRCPDTGAAEKMRNRVEEIIHQRNTLGGVLEVIVLNVPVGLGSFAQWDRRLEARLGAAVLSVQAIKGVEIGSAFQNASLTGTEVQDTITLDAGGGNLVRQTNRAGGIEAGISNGKPIVIRAAMKPIASTLTPQRTVDLARGVNSATNYERSDFCPVPRAVPVLEAMVAFVIAAALLEKTGGDSMDELMPRVAALRKARMKDLPMDNHEHIWWE